MFLRPTGIQKRTVTVILATVLPAFAVFSLGLMLYRNSLLPTRVQQVLQPYAELLAVSAAPALADGNRERAQEILNRLKFNASILRADIIQADGSTLATYPATNSPLSLPQWKRLDGTFLGAGMGELLLSVPQAGPKPAHIFIRMSLAGMLQREWQTLRQLWLAAALILGLFAGLQYVLLRRWVLSPLAQLAAIAESAGRQGDYSARMPAHDRDEFGQLGKRFNALLAGVEQRESALRQLASFQRAILNNAAYAIVSTDTAGRVTSFNPAAEELLGWPAQELIGQAQADVFFAPEELEAHAKIVAAKLGQPVAAGFEAVVAEARSGLRNEVEWTCRRKDGGRVPVLVSVTALRDEGGIIGFLGLAADITERRQAEAKLQEREQQYRLLFENMVTGFALHEIICDEQGRPTNYR